MKTFQAAANAVVSGPMPEKGHDGHGHHQHHAGHEERPFSFANAQPLKVRRAYNFMNRRVSPYCIVICDAYNFD